TLTPTTALTVRGAYYQTVDRRNYPEMDIGEEGYRGLWPSGWWQPYMEGRPIVYFPNFQIPSGDTFGVRNFWWQQPHGTSVSAKLDKYFGSHAVKAGADVRWKRGDAARYWFTNLFFTANNTANTTAGALTTTGYEWASFLLGALDPGSSSVQFTPLQQSHTEMYALYLQDDYRINSRLTVNVGLRYEYEGGYWDEFNRLPQRLDLNDPIPGLQSAVGSTISNLNVGNTGRTVAQVMAQSAGQQSHIYNGAFYFTEDNNKRMTEAEKLQLMPRLGLAFRIDDKTALRAGFGRFFTPSSLSDSGNEPLGSLDLASFSPTTNALPLSQGIPQVYLNNPFPQGLTPAYGKSYGRYSSLGDNITIDQYERRPPVSDRVNFSLQRELLARTVMELTYLVNFSSRNPLNINVNMVDPRLSTQYGVELTRTVANPFYNYGTESTFPGALRRQATVAVSQLLRPYPQYGNIIMTSTDVAKYRFHSLQVRLQRPFLNGFSFVTAYAYNREKSEQFYDDQDQYDRKLTWTNSSNPRHRVTAGFTAEVPFGRNRHFGNGIPKALDYVLGGWQVAGTFLYRSGQFLNFGAMLAPDSVTKIGDTGRDGYWFDTTGFVRLPAYTRRTNPVQYSNLTGPSFWNMDGVLSKGFDLPRSVRLEARLEAYNLFNTIMWANPQMSITASDFGRTNNLALTNFGRRLQFSARIQF
ncbi:MAG: TonB-dependent receptor, partial [Vicinamibacterales bacterium]|nr:TonB-dependent receptor [Vicinamibacterales bacterium]